MTEVFLILLKEEELSRNNLRVLSLLTLSAKGVLATNSDFLIPISLKPNTVDHRYFKLSILKENKILGATLYSEHHQVAKIYG